PVWQSNGQHPKWSLWGGNQCAFTAHRAGGFESSVLNCGHERVPTRLTLRRRHYDQSNQVGDESRAGVVDDFGQRLPGPSGPAKRTPGGARPHSAPALLTNPERPRRGEYQSAPRALRSLEPLVVDAHIRWRIQVGAHRPIRG